MPQLVTRLDDDLLGQIDALVDQGAGDNRSDVVRRAIRELVERHRRAAVGRAIVAEYSARPQTNDEIGWADAAAAAMIADEPW